MENKIYKAERINMELTPMQKRLKEMDKEFENELKQTNKEFAESGLSIDDFINLKTKEFVERNHEILVKKI